MRLNTWEEIIAQLQRVGTVSSEKDKIQLLIELLINLRLLGQDERIPDLREKKGDIETLYADIARETRGMLETVSNPSSNFIYYTREVLKKLPMRQDAEEIIEQIRAAAEEFEEARSEDDPVKSFAGDLRKEIHRRLSPRIIQGYLVPYLQLVKHENPAPMIEAGYVALPHFFSADDEDRHFIDLAEYLLENMRYLWDYDAGNLAAVKRQLEQNLPVFERCFLKAEVSSFLDLLTSENLAKPHLEMDLLKRLASLKHYLKESYRETRISLYDFVLLDLALGRLVFLLANDLTNNHFAELSFRNFREALAVIHELLNISSVKGLAIGHVGEYQAAIDELREASVYDYIKAKLRLGAISKELQRYLQSDIIDAMSRTLNKILEEYEVPTSRLNAVKTKFFNNFIRRTQIHVLSEFVEKIVAAVDKELERQADARQLYAEFYNAKEMPKRNPESYIAATWKDVAYDIRPSLGGKGNSLIDMTNLGLRVPPAFILGFPFFADCGPEGQLGEDLKALIFRSLSELEQQSGRRLGDPERTLLVSIRSGAPTSMPGVMATILNVGWSPEVRAAIKKRRGSAIASILYRRFLENSLAAVGLMPGKDAAARAEQTEKLKKGGIAAMEAYLAAALGETFLVDPYEQLIQGIRLVYASRGSLAVRAYSRAIAAHIRADTAVTVQQLVFGNLNEKSLSGVFITRNPITGNDELFGEFKRAAQGEEVVMGSASTEPIARLDAEISEGLEKSKAVLVQHFLQDLDIEFTVEDGTLYFLQARSARLGAFAQLVADTDFLARGLIDLTEYRARTDRLEMAYASAALPRADFLSRKWIPPLTIGVPINGGVVSGTLVLSEDRLKEAEDRRESVVYLANSTKPTDFAIMNGAHAIVTIYPGRTSHAAITAMSMNKPCIVGCGDVEIDYEKHLAIFRAAGSLALREGERVTADGNTGALYRGIAPVSEFFLPISSVSAAVAHCTDAQEAASAVKELIDSKLSRLSRETSFHRASLDAVDDFQGAKVLVRIDANVRIDGGEVIDEERLLQALPTLESILQKGGTPIVCSHLGDPGAGRDVRQTREDISRDFSLQPVAEVFESRLGSRFFFHKTSVAASGLLITKKNIRAGVVNLLENLRFAAGERDNDDNFARALAGLSDGWYVNDAFNVSSRRHASITGVPKFLEHRLAGPLVIKELAALELLLEKAPHPYAAVFDSEEAETQLGVMAALLPRLDSLAVLALTKTARPGEKPPLTQAAQSALKAFREAYPGKVTLVSGHDGDHPKNMDHFIEQVDKAKAILWASPASLSVFAGGGARQKRSGPPPHIEALHRAIRRQVVSVVCHEEERRFSDLSLPGLHVSTGPRSFLEYLERLSLPGITLLDPAEQKPSLR